MSEALSLEQINKAVTADCEICLLQSVDSTNEWVLQKARAGAGLPLACFAEAQSRGRGRRGKSWISSAGSNIAMSLAWQFNMPVSEIGALSLAMGIAVIHALESAGVGKTQLKWPNDVLVDGKKIAGILIETAGITETGVIAVIGVGVNYDLPDTLPELPAQPWTDVLSQLPRASAVNRSQLAGHLLQSCLKICERYLPDRESLMTEFREKYDICDRQPVTVSLENGELYHGIACGVTSAGEIRVRSGMNERVFNSADISLRRNTTE